MKRTLTVILAILMMLFAAGCYGNATPEGTTRNRAHGGSVTRGRAYHGAYDGLYRDSNRDGFIRDGAGVVDGNIHGTPRAHGGTTRAHGGATPGHNNRAQNGAMRGRTISGSDGFFTDGTAARDYQNHLNNRPAVGGLEYLR